jgi:Putative adhesin
MKLAKEMTLAGRGLCQAAAGISAAAVALALVSMGAASARQKTGGGSRSGPRLTQDLTGSVPTHEGERVRLSTELGSILIQTQDADRVDYRIHLESDASEKDARQLLKSFTVSVSPIRDGVALKAEAPARHWTGRFWATLELSIPKNVSLDVSTGGGNIDAQEIQGHVTLSTAGGNITAGDIGGPARLETGGGNIVAKSVAGELYASTGGGHIVIGSIAGNAALHTSGGHIRVASIQGTARLETGGGNITLGHSGAELVASTDGGEIQVGEAAGLVRAKTGGGGIRVVRMVGPTDLETGGGSIYLTQVDSPVKASTSSGGITAWFVSPPKPPGTCDLQSSDGDIVVHLPRQLPVTIDAQVENGNKHRVIVDPAFPLKVSYNDSSKAHAMRAEGALNGGGELLRLRTVAGNIRFVLSDRDKQLELYKQQMAELERQTQELEKQLMEQGLTLHAP